MPKRKKPSKTSHLGKHRTAMTAAAAKQPPGSRARKVMWDLGNMSTGGKEGSDFFRKMRRSKRKAKKRKKR